MKIHEYQAKEILRRYQVPVPRVKEWEDRFVDYLHSNHPDFEQKMVSGGYKLTDEIEALVLKALDDFNGDVWAGIVEAAK